MKKFNIDLRKCSDYVDGEHQRKIVNSLERRGVYNDFCLYTLIDGEREKEFLEKGTYRKDNEIFALNQKDLLWENDNNPANALKELAEMYSNPALAVWNKEQFLQTGAYCYEFKNPDKKLEALLGIAFLKLGPDF